ncbi:MAG: EAL domain-containing protein [Chloroflexi bacterium]|nr:EAL domain-containing protein [Chloroflexota bacterium]
MLTKLRTPFVFLVVLAVGSAAAAGIFAARSYEEARHHRSVALEAARAEANLISALEWQATADEAVSPELSERREAAAGQLRAEIATVPGGSALHDIAETYIEAVELQFSLLEQGKSDEARDLDEARVDPSFEALTEELTATVAHYRADAARAGAVGQIASIAILIGAVLLVGVLLWFVERSNRRAQALADRESARQESDERIRPVQVRLEELAAAVEATPDYVVTLEGTGRVKYVNRAMYSLLGLRDGEHGDEVTLSGVLGALPASARSTILSEGIHAAARDGSWTGEAAVISAAGREIPVLVSIVVHREPSGGIRVVSVMARDVSTQKQLEDELRHQAFHDPLTGLSNRARFHDRLEHALTRSRRTAEQVAVVFIDLDEFKAVNDSHGHELGDALLVAVGTRLAEMLREGDTIARLGGDEFALLLDGTIDRDHAEIIAERVVEAMHAPFCIDGLEVMTHVSAGVALSTGGETANELLRRADLAMYTSKAEGKNRSRTFDLGIQEAMGGRLEIMTELQGAVERDEFVLDFQPTFKIATGAMTGAEALVRWQHPVRGLIAPLTFIPLAEESGVIVELGQWVLDRACEQLAEWQRMGSPDMTVAINVSARQLQQSGFVDTVRSALEKFDLAPGSLTIEITESATMRDIEDTSRVLTELKALGVRLAIDDFGTGYSSLSYLRQFPFDILKIDKSFVDTITTAGSRLTSAIIGIARGLELEIVAEGVEEHDQLAILRSLACDTAQGFLFSRPVPPSEISALLRQSQSDAA